ncbi:hypothetical protein DFJ69_6024 [Thermomonospora umbrina]|uniref:Uncharacterized protein n=2 Tax=Thermomonospora umbrina TaxID=111806 RepID=A0A3D9T9P2_9ACTN|nr:hypothetical protein DFJ69_6024 [Thermomonospora umbrina]
MMHYDRLRHEGFPPASAMWYAAPFFSRDPHIRVGDPGPVRAALPPADPNAVQWTATAHDLTDAEVRRWLAEQQGRQIINRLQDGAEATNREPWSPTELTAELEKRTNLEPDVIATIVAEDAHTRGVNLEAARANYETALADTAARDRATNLGDAFDNPATTHVNEQPHRMSASERETLKQDAARARASSAAAMVTEEYPHTPQHAVAHTTKYGSKGRAPASQTTPEQTRRSRPGSGPTT